MSLILRSLLRDPYVTRPLARAVRRYDDDYWLDEWQPRQRRVAPGYDSAAMLLDAMNRQMDAAVNSVQDFAHDLEAMDAFVGQLDGPRNRRANDTSVKRTESGGLQLALDVADFKPEDLKIQLLDGHLVVEAVRESSAENSYSRNHFKRWFKLPEDCKLEDIKSKLTRDNKLVIDLPSKRPLEHKGQNIPIEMEKPVEQPANQTAQEGNPQAESKASK